jgi:hypothetical protein
MEEKYCYKNDFRTPILPPIKIWPPECSGEPEEAQVLGQALPLLPLELPCCTITAELLDSRCKRVVDKVDPPRFFPLIGPARLHHVRWKCVARLAVTVELSWPVEISWTSRGERVVYVDTDHLHVDPSSPNAPPAPPAAGREKSTRPLATDEGKDYVLQPPDIVNIQVTRMTPRSAKGRTHEPVTRPIEGEHLIRPDGNLSLGPDGSVAVAGKSVAQAKAAIERHLSRYFVDPEITLDVISSYQLSASDRVYLQEKEEPSPAASRVPENKADPAKAAQVSLGELEDFTLRTEGLVVNNFCLSEEPCLSSAKHATLKLTACYRSCAGMLGFDVLAAGFDASGDMLWACRLAGTTEKGKIGVIPEAAVLVSVGALKRTVRISLRAHALPMRFKD